jgi:hypothetical protein
MAAAIGVDPEAQTYMGMPATSMTNRDRFPLRCFRKQEY